MQVAVRNLGGDEVGQVDLDDYIFGITPNVAVIQQAVLRQQANARQGTHNTKTRAYVSGGGRKPWRQKGTGRARQGSTRSPQWTHGGVVFGPHTRSYEQDMPRKMRRLAIRGVLSAKAADNQIVVVENFDDLEPRTRAMKDALTSLNVGESTVLIMTASQEETLEKAAGNLTHVKTMPASILSVVDMLKFDYLVMPQASLDIITSILGNTGGRRKISRVRGTNGTSTASPASAVSVVESPVTTAEPAEAPAAKTPRKAASSRRAAAAPVDEPEAEVVESVTFAPTAAVADVAESTIEPAAEDVSGTSADETGSEEA